MKIEENNDIILGIKEFSILEKEEILGKLNTSINGLSYEKIIERQEKYGKNIIDVKNNKTLLNRLKEAIINPFNIVLILVAVVTFFTDVVIQEKKDYLTFTIIISTIIISSLISFFQQASSDKAVQKLKKMISNKIYVIRNGNEESIDDEEIVLGDIVKLSSGDMLPGDVRFLETKDLFLDQASLTGESNPVEKFSKLKGEKESLTDLSNIGFMGTNVVSGSAKAVIIGTGNQTYFGSMAKSLYSVNEKNSFEKGIDSVSKLLIKFIAVMIPIIFIINFFTKGDWWNSLIFAITIAVGLTPEMLPVIMTSTLAKGAIDMSKKKTIVKRLSSIQTFGEMNILCTDKTGTLTEDEIILEKYMDINGNESTRVLKHAFLNSFFQTGLKNLIDIAIISRAEKEKMNILKEKYIREDEIPFDFSRRRMSVVLRDEYGKRQLITKGAVDEVVSICSYIDINGEAINFSDKLKSKVYEVYEKYNHKGLRIVAVAQKNHIHGIETFGVNDEKDMVLIGFVGFLDPPKKSAKQAIIALKKHGVDTVVLTGDSEGVAINVCNKVGISTKNSLTGKQIENMDDTELKEKSKICHLYSKLSPIQKQRIVKIYQEQGNTVGYMGDGINDSPPLKQADVGISVDTGVDIAKETADIILLEKDLNVLEQGVITGRKTFTNILKYLKMAISGNFGNMLSIIIASIFLPFLPLLPVHILIQNLLNDFAQIGMPFDNVDNEYLQKPRKWDTKWLKRNMFVLGTASTFLDILCFLILWNIFNFNTFEKAVLFQTGWFAFGIISQTLIIHLIRTSKIPFVTSWPSKQLVISTLTIVLITLIISFTDIAVIFDLSKLPIQYGGFMILLIMIYGVIIRFCKKVLN